MNAFINKIISAFLAVVCMMMSVFSVKDAQKVTAEQYAMPGSGSCEAGDGRVGVHDPSIVQSEDGTFYLFGSHGCAAKSEDMIHWANVACGINDNNRLLVPEGETLRSALSEPLSWTDAYQQVNGYDKNNWQTNIWAADVIYNKEIGKYCYYGSSSVWGTPGSVIWLATSDNIEGPYKYEKSLVYSGFNNLTNNGKFYSRVNALHFSFTNIPELFKQGVFSVEQLKNAPWFNINGEYDHTNYPNCIDPALFYDENGRLWMNYGSFFGGIYLMPMDGKTGFPDYDYMKNAEGYDTYFGKKIIKTALANELSGEGPYITYDSQSGYYYLFVSYSGLNALGGYNIREYRSKTVDGPYLDAAGHSTLDDKNTGAKLFGNYKFDCLTAAYLSGGHSSAVTTNDGKLLISYHTRFENGGEGYQSRVHQMAKTENGWAVVLPFEYQGEVIDYKGFDKSKLVGEYEFINHGTISNGCTDWADVENIIAPTQSVTLNADGTITGVRAYESIKENTAVSSKDVDGTWKVKDGTAYITFVIDGTEYEGIYCVQKDESSKKTEKLVFSAIGNNNECLWGVKK